MSYLRQLLGKRRKTREATGNELVAISGEVSNDDDFGIADPGLMPAMNFGGDLPDFSSDGEAAADPVDRLRNLIGERQEETVEILRSWLEDREEKA